MSKMYIVCCGREGRAVLIGESDNQPVAGQSLLLKNARMVLYWDAECGGLLGLAAGGPKGKTRITRSVSVLEDSYVNSWVEVSDQAREEINQWPSV
jgi:hypothetical protein